MAIEDFLPEHDCFCERDSDGQCSKCRDVALSAGARFKTLIKTVLASIQQMQAEFMARMKSTIGKMADDPKNVDLLGACDGCAEQYIDLAVSKMVEALRDEDRSTGIIVIQSIVRRIHARGIKKLPLTEKAWLALSGESRSFSA